MWNKVILIIVVAICLVGPALAKDWYTLPTSTTSLNWGDPASWTDYIGGASVPGATDNAMVWNGGVTISAGTNAQCDNLYTDFDGVANGMMTIEMTGGTFYANTLWLGWAGYDQVTWHQTGGTAEAFAVYMPYYEYAPASYMQLDGGTFTSQHIIFNKSQTGGNGFVDLAGGTYIEPLVDAWGLNALDYLPAAIENGWITGFGKVGEQYVNVVVDEVANTVTLTGVPEPATMVLLGLGGFGLLRRKRS